MLGPGTGLVSAFTPGENGMPTSGNQTDLQGRADDVTLTFNDTRTINCTGDTAQQLNVELDYSISGAALPAGSTLVVYLSPNNGAINNNAGGDAAGYIADRRIERNLDRRVGAEWLRHADVLDPRHDPFVIAHGGVLAVIATDVDGSEFNSKTNSINCGEAEYRPRPPRRRRRRHRRQPRRRRRHRAPDADPDADPDANPDA